MSNEKLHNTNEKAASSGIRYLSFSLGEEEYAIPLLAVREVIAMPEITPIPYSPAHFLGIMNLRGQVISITDLRTKLGIKPDASKETAVIICDLSGLSIGVVVDSINQVVCPSDSELSAKPDVQTNKNSEYITEVYRRQQSLVLLIDIAKALGINDLNLAAKASANAA